MEATPLSASTSAPSASQRKQLRTAEDIHISLKENASGRRQWIDSIKDKVRHHLQLSPLHQVNPSHSQWLPYVQIFSWHFDVFSLDKTTGGNPLITVTIALLEVYGLLVRYTASKTPMRADASPFSSA
jgi:hypothetical protein